MFMAVMLLGLATPLQRGTLGAAVIAAVRGQPVSVGAAFSSGVSRYFTLLGASIVGGLCTMVGMLLLIVPGFYVYLGFSMASLAIVDERLGALAGLRRSWTLADGKRGTIFGILFAWGILQMVLSYGVSALLQILTLDQMARPLAQGLTQALIMPCATLSMMLVMDDVRTTREGRDLALEAERLAAAAPPAAL
jgi:hypothetical protein